MITTNKIEVTDAEKAAIIVGLRMYARVVESSFGSITFSKANITGLMIFDEVESIDARQATALANCLGKK